METGELVKSVAGHDRDWLYAVLKTEDGFAFLVDGRHHGLENPKKKKLKHIVRLGVKSEGFDPKCDAHIRKAIKKMKSEGGCYLG